MGYLYVCTSNWKLSSLSGPEGNYSLTTTTLSDPGTYTLKYRFTYDGETKETQNITVTITEPATPDPPLQGDTGTGTDTDT